MKKSDIQVGKEYKIRSGHSGRARVTGEARRRDSYSQVYVVPVEFPDSIRDGKPIASRVETKDVLREWTADDEHCWQQQMAIEAKSEEVEQALAEIGVRGSVSVRGNGIWLTFSGDEAEAVIEKLTGMKIESEGLRA